MPQVQNSYLVQVVHTFFERNAEGSWNQVQILTASDKDTSDFFGSSVSISGNVAAIGAETENEDANGENHMESAGAAYIFEKNAYGEWSEVQKIVSSGREERGHFGTVSISGNSILVGASDEGTEGSVYSIIKSPGVAYIFEKNDEGTWYEKQKLLASDRDTWDDFGAAVSISGNYCLIGAPHKDLNEPGNNLVMGAGAAYIFKRDNDGKWYEFQKLTAIDGSKLDRFGYAVSISGNYAIISAKDEDHNAHMEDSLHNAGSAYIYECDDSGTWNFVQKIVASDRAENDLFGFSVSIDGDYAVVGNNNIYTNKGAAYIYKRDASGTWKEVQKVQPNNEVNLGEEGLFGYRVSNSGDYFVAGFPYDNIKLVKIADPDPGEDPDPDIGTNPVAVNDNEAMEALIYPNPASEVINVITISGSVISLYSITGTLLWHGECYNKIQIPVHGLPIGVYIIKINTKGILRTYKLIVSKRKS